MSGRHKHRRTCEPLVARAAREPNSRKIMPGTDGRGIIASVRMPETAGSLPVTREYTLHATKGYRGMRLV